MRKYSFNDNWKFWKDGTTNIIDITLPHDAMIYEKRDSENTAGLGYFPGGKYFYEKTWTVEIEKHGKTQILEFEGIYENATVWVNEHEVAHHIYGYTGFFVDITPYINYGSENTVRVLADNSQQPNSRWYSGSGMYRPVHLWIGGESYILPEGIKIETVSIEPAILNYQIETEGVNKGLEAKIEILYQQKKVAEASGFSGEITIPEANLWCGEHPHLYQAKVTLQSEKEVLDEAEVDFGIRSIQWNTQNGLLINSESVKLRGACVHHDNGVVGACAFWDAESRKVRILKEAGFNAVRCAHNPCSKYFLEACDRYGMYVMDEAFDSWTIPKNSKDYSIHFVENYKEDLQAMVKKDMNHPSVIMYSIGNETVESAKPEGVEYMASMRQIIHELDTTRPITCGISITQNIDWQKGTSAKEEHMGGIEKEDGASPVDRIKPWMLPILNVSMKRFYKKMNEPLMTDVAEVAIVDACGQLDIPGYNYGEDKMPYDDERNPNRIVVNSETHHTELFEHWPMIESRNRVIGDFMWTGWDYIGETGVGALGYATRGGIGFDKPYPYLTAASGIIDITGFLKPEVYWTQMIWHQTTKPVIAVEPLEYSGVPYMMTYWNDTEADSSWSWPGYEGTKATVKVYTTDDSVTLYLNGKKVGKKKAKRNMAVFKIPYKSGVLMAETFDKEGNRKEMTQLVSANGTKKIYLQPECNSLNANGQDLLYLNISITDDNGVLYATPQSEIHVEVLGEGVLQGLGSGAIFTEDSFVAGKCHVHRGRALAVIRAGKTKGEIQVKVTCGDLQNVLIIPVI